MKVLLAAVVSVVLLSGCGAVTASGDDPNVDPIPSASGELIGQGTVISEEGGAAMLCLGAVMESYPPQCSGPEIIGWDWSAADHSESASGVTWGTYAVQGTWDGLAFTITRPPIPLALYDPPANIDPRTDPANRGAGDDAELESLQSDVHEFGDSTVLTSWIDNGYLFVTVVYDNGTLQDAYDARYGNNIVAVQSALQPVAP